MTQLDSTEHRRMWRTFARIMLISIILSAIVMVLLALITL